MYFLSRGISLTAEPHNFHYFHPYSKLSLSYHINRKELNFGHLRISSSVTLLLFSPNLPKVLTVFKSSPVVNSEAGLRW